MRYALIAFYCCALTFAPLFLFAQTPPAATPPPAPAAEQKICANAGEDSSALAKRTQAINKSAKCIDQRVTQSTESGKACITFTTTNDPTKGGTVACKPNVCGKVTIVINGKVVNVQDKCKGKAGVNGSNAADQSKGLLGDTVERTDFKVPSDGKLTSEQKAIFEAFGIKEADGLAMATKNPEATKDLLAGLAGGDTARTTDAAAKLSLTDDQLKGLRDSAANLSPEKVAAAVEFNNPEGAAYLRQQVKCESDGSCSTFSQPGEREKMIISPQGQPSAQMLAGNKLQPQVLGALAADAQRQVCANVSRCYVTAEKQFATMMNESPGDVRIIGDGGKSMSIGQVYEPTARSLASRYEQVFGERYMLNDVNIKDPSLNPDWIASQSLRMQALVIQEKATRVGGDEFRTLVAYNGAGPAAVNYGYRAASNVNRLTNGSAPSYWQQSYNAAQQASANGPTIQNLVPTGALPPAPPPSPFSFGGNNQNPFSGFNGGFPSGGPTSPMSFPPSSVYQPVQQPALPAQPAPIPQPGSVTPVVPNATPGSTGTPVSTLVVQGKNARPGDTVPVSWSSVNMSSSATCKVQLVTRGTVTPIGTGNEGTKSVKIPSDATNPTTIEILCTGTDGTALPSRSQTIEIK